MDKHHMVHNMTSNNTEHEIISVVYHDGVYTVHDEQTGVMEQGETRHQALLRLVKALAEYKDSDEGLPSLATEIFEVNLNTVIQRNQVEVVERAREVEQVERQELKDLQVQTESMRQLPDEQRVLPERGTKLEEMDEKDLQTVDEVAAELDIEDSLKELPSREQFSDALDGDEGEPQE